MYGNCIFLLTINLQDLSNNHSVDRYSRISQSCLTTVHSVVNIDVGNITYFL